MKTFSTAVAAITLFAAGSAIAAADAQTGVGMSAVFSPTCTLAPVTVPSGQGATLVSGATASAATIDLTGMMNPADATFVSGTAFTIAFDGMCNYAHTIRLRTNTGAFKAVTAANDPVPASGPFVRSLNYTAVATWGASTIILATDGTANKKSPGGAVTGSRSGSGTIVVGFIDPAVPARPMQAGTWTDVLVMQIGAPL